MFRLLLLVLMSVAPLYSSAHQNNPESLVIANSKAWKPFSFINENGQPDGILVDYWREYSRMTGTPVTFLLVDWNESLQAVKDGRADVHGGLLWSRERDVYLDYGQSIMRVETQLFINRIRLNIDVAELLSGKHSFVLGVVEGGIEHSFAIESYPNVAVNTFDNNADMIAAAFKGEIDGFIAERQVAYFYFHSSKANLQFTSVKHLYSGLLRPATSQGHHDLLTRLMHGMASVSNESKQKIFSRWMYIETVYPNYLVPILTAAFVIAVFSYMILLRITVRSKTKELEKANSELKYLSETDQLTGLSNRYHFYSQFSNRVANNDSVCIMLFDIDDFKLINDTYGHQVGDVVIRSVGQAALKVIKSPHLIGRIGGEEFAVVCTNIDVAQAKSLSELLCHSIRALVLFEDQTRVTVSLGCAYYHIASADISLSEADSLMYQAKAKGKDQFVLAQYWQLPLHGNEKTA